MSKYRFVALTRALTLTLVIILGASHALAVEALQEKDELFAGAEKFAAKAKTSSEVNLDSRMLGLASGFGGGDNSGLMKKLDFVIVRSYEYDKAGDYNMADVEPFTKRLESGGWSHLVKERSATESTDVCVRIDRENQISELVVIDAEPKELTFVHLKGHLSMKDLMKAGASYGVPQGAPDPPAPDPKLQKR
jgi:hypothetical protein